MEWFGLKEGMEVGRREDTLKEEGARWKSALARLDEGDVKAEALFRGPVTQYTCPGFTPLPTDEDWPRAQLSAGQMVQHFTCLSSAYKVGDLLNQPVLMDVAALGMQYIAGVKSTQRRLPAICRATKYKEHGAISPQVSQICP